MFGSEARKKRAQPDIDRRVASHLIVRGDAARDARDWTRAALWYEEAVRLVPRRADIHVQHGHMLKESGDLVAAERAYMSALALMPDDADLALQIGHLHKIAGRADAARDAYGRALILKPGWEAPAWEIEKLAEGIAAAVELPEAVLPEAGSALAAAGAALARAEQAAELVPNLEPRNPSALLNDFREGLELRQMGRHERSVWGIRRTAQGVTAVRGFCISALPVDEVQMLLDGKVFYRGPLRGPYRLKHARRPNAVAKYVFNIWYDFSMFAPGRYSFELRVVDAEGGGRSFHDDIVVAPALAEADFADSDALVEASGPDPVELERRVRQRPSMTRTAQRSLLPAAPRNILVLRTDQLGDLVASVPAMRRLREIFDGARIVGLFTNANAELAATLGLFDEVIVIDFPDDPDERRRVMPLSAQEALRARLAPYAFDLAIDLAQAGVSRDLLRLSGAPFLYGVEGGGFHWLSADFSLNTRDPLNRLDIAPHSRKTLALVETLGAIVNDSFAVTRRDDLSRDRLACFGVAPADRYAVLHLGARVAFSRWPGFSQLATLLLDRTDLKIVMMTEDPKVRASLPPDLAASPRFQLLDQRLPFDDFDAFVSFAAVLIGNDSGPKHLASLRGTNTITLHTARINWNTWGHEGAGSIISRRVPCAGCDIFHDAEECGKDFACIRDITAEEVFAAVSAYV